MPADKRKPLISGNWKMHHNHFEAIQCVQKLSYMVSKEDFETVDVSIHPPFTDIRSVQTVIESDDMRFLLGAQNCHFEEKGAFTGEIAAGFLAKLSVSYVIVGHSERRELFGETDDVISKKITAVFKAGMTPIVCVGETLEERENGRTEEKVLSQVRAAIAKRPPEQVGSMVIAYEPIWAIGTGKTATAADAQAVCGAIRREVIVSSGNDVGERVRIQYGGSVKAANAAEIMAQPDIDRALVGGASLDPEEFSRIVQYRLHA